MSYYEVRRPESGPSLARVSRATIAVSVAVVAILVLASGALSTVPIEVDGVSRRVPMGTPVARLADQGLTTARAGDLLAAADGRVLVDGGGTEPGLLVDGRPMAPDELVRRPVRIESVPGQDVVERVVTIEEPIAIPVMYEGEGSLVSLTRTGAVGRRLVSRGAVSDQVFRMEVLDDPVPMMLTRARPDPGSRVVALTFDDGPWPGQTEEILEILEAADVRATFFMLGLQVRRHPALARAVRDGGHTLGNHTYGHSILRRATKQEVRDEIEPCRQAIEDATGIVPQWFRPPGGLASPSVHAVCKEKDLRVVGWTVDPQDWTGKDADELVEEVLDAVEPGAVVLLHDGGGDRSATIEALPVIIEQLRRRGYGFVTLDQTPALAIGGYGS